MFSLKNKFIPIANTKTQISKKPSFLTRKKTLFSTYKETLMRLNYV